MTELSKWPLLLVTGNPVTEQQANDILIRTDQWAISTNDRAWEAAVWKLTGLQPDKYNRPAWPAVDEFRQHLDCLDLHYLHNERIASAWIGGPHGWCDWDGTIGTSNYNIGKHPTIEEAHQDWTAIAAAFPYLNLRAQLVPEEGEAGAAAVEWCIAGGVATMVEDPARLLRRPTDPDSFRLFAPDGERGVGLDRLAVAIDQVRAARSGPVAESL